MIKSARAALRFKERAVADLIELRRLRPVLQNARRYHIEEPEVTRLLEGIDDAEAALRLEVRNDFGSFELNLDSIRWDLQNARRDGHPLMIPTAQQLRNPRFWSFDDTARRYHDAQAGRPFGVLVIRQDGLHRVSRRIEPRHREQPSPRGRQSAAG